ncbi:unnamed protein product [Hermetia illucens]|uniref:Odorant receptor n=1 Tax=Hermetia illucens TaxID=343691 RepID=A0A7R8US60_HERIL|nr:odorant receptor 59a-like [Hermetia illucens]CAD7085730.1 unnamed protein product [Hermetia illucens]
MIGTVEKSKKVTSSDAFKFNFKFWQILGVYPIRSCSILYAVFITLSGGLTATMTIFLFSLDRLNDILLNLSVNATSAAINLKSLNIFFRRQTILDANIWIRHLDSRASSAQEQACLLLAVRRARIVFYLTCAMFFSSIILGEFAALLSNEGKLMCPAWYPFDWRYSILGYSIVHVHQMVVLMIYALENISNDTFPAVYMLVLTSHVKTLNIRIRKLGMDSAKSCKDNCQELIQCIKDQQILIEYFHMVRKATSAAIFLQFFVTGIGVCVTAVCAFFANGNLFEIIYLAEYSLCIILEIFLYCYFGNELADESNRMSGAIYSCNWTNQDKSFRKNLLIFLQSTQTNMMIVAGGIFPVDLSTFVSVMKSSYSLFAVLMQMT